MRDAGDDDRLARVIDGIDDAVITHSNPIVVTPNQGDDAVGSGFGRQIVDGARDAGANRVVEPLVRPRCVGMEPNLVGERLATGYRRVSDQGTLRPTSSRAWSAARLSSRKSMRSTSSV